MKILCKNKYWSLNEDYNINKTLYLLIDRPNIIYTNCFCWINDKEQFHRKYDLPAYVSSAVIWYNENFFHRNDNKPARICFSGGVSFYRNGNFVKQEK